MASIVIAIIRNAYRDIEKLRLYNKDTNKIIDIEKETAIELTKRREIENLKIVDDKLLGKCGKLCNYPTIVNGEIEDDKIAVVLYKTLNGFIIINGLGRLFKISNQSAIRYKQQYNICNGRVIKNELIPIKGSFEIRKLGDEEK